MKKILFILLGTILLFNNCEYKTEETNYMIVLRTTNSFETITDTIYTSGTHFLFYDDKRDKLKVCKKCSSRSNDEYYNNVLYIKENTQDYD